MGAGRKRTKRSPAAAAAAAAISVLCYDDLLREILLRLDFPTCLVRSAAVCKAWLRQASDPAFLRRFRDLHPPRLLGFYFHTGSGFLQRLQFVPMLRVVAKIEYEGCGFLQHLRQPSARGRFDLGEGPMSVSDCRNGRLIVLNWGRFQVRSPLHPARGTAAVPKLYTFDTDDTGYRPLLPEGANDNTVVALVCDDQRGWIHVSESIAGAWGKRRASHLIQLPEQWRICAFGLLAYGKLYMFRRVGYILGLDLPSKSFFRIQLPEGVEYESYLNFMMSRAEGCGFYLICAKDSEILVWRHSTGCSTGNWELVDSICLIKVLGNLVDPLFWLSAQDPIVRVSAVGDNADFVFFQIEYEVFYMHIRSRAVEKVHDLQSSELDFDIHPFIMVWPPTFPALVE